MSKHLNLFFPQWQGGDDRPVYDGGCQIKGRYVGKCGVERRERAVFQTVEVDLGPLSPEKSGIKAYDQILTQMTEASKVLRESEAETVFTLGGGCDADLPPVAYLNDLYKGDLAVLWLDAHGDLNTPETSGSKLFYGMPARTLMGEGDAAFLRLVPRPVKPSQHILLGGRDLDQGEADCIREKQIAVISEAQLDRDPTQVAAQIRKTGCSNVYIHIDLDVLEPAKFPCVPVPEAGGISHETLLAILNKVRQEFRLVGMGLYEYMAFEDKGLDLLDAIVEIGTGL